MRAENERTREARIRRESEEVERVKEVESDGEPTAKSESVNKMEEVKQKESKTDGKDRDDDKIEMEPTKNGDEDEWIDVEGEREIESQIVVEEKEVAKKQTLG